MLIILASIPRASQSADTQPPKRGKPATQPSQTCAHHAHKSSTKTLRIAAFEADVTPPIGSVLCHGNVSPAKEIVDPLSARGIVLLGSGEPIVLCAVDWVAISNKAHDVFRERLAEAAGTSPDRVAVHTVHQHDTPGVDLSTEEILVQHDLSGAMFDPDVCRQAIERTAAAVKDSLKKAVAVTHVGYGKGRVEKVASNRRILNDEGKCVMTRMSSCRNEAARAAPEGLIDPDVRLVSFWAGDRPVASLTYYACHPQSYYGKGGVSYDFMGMARTARQQAVPAALHVHFDGAGGNIAAGKYNDGSPENRPVLAARLAKGMEEAWNTQKKAPIGVGDVAWAVQPVQLPVRETLTENDILKRLTDQSLDRKKRVFAARDLAWLHRMTSGHQIPLACLRVGPVSVLHMPGELCVEYQLAAQKMCPGQFVAMAAYGDDGPGYICTEIAYRQGGYETTHVSRVAPGVEQVLTATMQQLLEATRQ
ncbi:MAG: nucleoside hydrolase [Planctomycetaceae bacterium]|nr:nucleoside hydrolase [Planctomycetaceae bacterium]